MTHRVIQRLFSVKFLFGEAHYLESSFTSGRMLLKRGTGSGERGAGSGERGAGSGERGAGNGERKSGNELSAETSIKIQYGR